MKNRLCNISKLELHLNKLTVSIHVYKIGMRGVMVHMVMIARKLGRRYVYVLLLFLFVSHFILKFMNDKTDNRGGK